MKRDGQPCWPAPPDPAALDAAWALAWADRYLDRMSELGLLPDGEDTSALASHLATTIRELATDERERGRREASPGARPVSGACDEAITDRGDEHRQSVCLLVRGHEGDHHDPRTATSWTPSQRSDGT